MSSRFTKIPIFHPISQARPITASATAVDFGISVKDRIIFYSSFSPATPNLPPPCLKPES